MAKIKTEAARAAKEVKQILKQKFPHVAFSVKSENYTGGDSINIYWSFGPSEKQVKEFTSVRKQGYFDSMNDMYVYTDDSLEVCADGSISAIAGAKYIFENRDDRYISHKISGKYYELRADVLAIYDQIGKQHGWEFSNANKDYYPNGVWQGHDQTASGIYYRVVKECSFISDNIELLEIKYIGYGKGSGFEPYTLIYKDLNTGKVYDAKSLENFEEEKAAVQNEVKKEVMLINYSEKSFVVYGNTFPIKDTLKGLGGKFNAHLKHPETQEKLVGWVFSLIKKDSVVEEINKFIA